MKKTTLYLSLVFIFLSLASCHKSSSSSSGKSKNNNSLPVVVESEPNNDSSSSQELLMNQLGSGDLSTVLDVDFWSIPLVAGTVISVELLGAELDFGTWNTALGCPQLTLWAPDGVTKELEHAYGAAPSYWPGPRMSLDFPSFYVSVTGTYFVSVSNDNISNSGGNYAIQVITKEVNGLQFESEIQYVSGSNDSIATAEPIDPGVILGFHVNDEADYFSFSIVDKSIVTIGVTASQNGRGKGSNDYFDPDLSLYNQKGLPVKYNDDSLYTDPEIKVLLSGNETYFIEVGQCCGNGDSDYFLSLDVESTLDEISEVEPNELASNAMPIFMNELVYGTMPIKDVDMYSFSATAGDVIELYWFDGLNSAPLTGMIHIDLIDTDSFTLLPSTVTGEIQKISTIIQSTGTYFAKLYPVGTPFLSPTSYKFRIELKSQSLYEIEPNEITSNASAFDSSGRAAGVIGTDGDIDIFHFYGNAGTLKTFFILADGDSAYGDSFSPYSYYGSSLWPQMRVLDSEQNVLSLSISNTYMVSSNAKAITADANSVLSVSVWIPEDGTYYLEVVDSQESYGNQIFYQVYSD